MKNKIKYKYLILDKNKYILYSDNYKDKKIPLSSNQTEFMDKLITHSNKGNYYTYKEIFNDYTYNTLRSVFTTTCNLKAMIEILTDNKISIYNKRNVGYILIEK